MSRLNIRCCCTPQKILGSLPWPGWPANVAGTHRAFLVEPGAAYAGQRIETVIVEIRQFVDPDEPYTEWAIYGDDKPVEFWQKIRGYAPP